MNLIGLFETQKVLDERIIKDKESEGQDLLPEKILALLTELGELSNEWRGFKFWSVDREPRTYDLRPVKSGRKCYYNPLLEEYVDCLHFILSIGIELEQSSLNTKKDSAIKNDDVTKQFMYVARMLINVDVGAYLLSKENKHPSDLRILERDYKRLFLGFIGLGEMLGFTTDQIENAYYEKNKINHSRQENNY